MNKIRAAIIEDEIPAARLLNKMLTELRPEWEILLLPGNVEGAVKWFNNNPHPDILLSGDGLLPEPVLFFAC